MPRSLAPIPGGIQIVDRLGLVTDFFRLRWEELRAGFQQTPALAAVRKSAQTAALASTKLQTITSDGLYRLSYHIRKTVPDGVNSSLTVTFGWTNDVALTEVFAALTTDTATAHQSGSVLVRAKANSDLTVAVAYTSNTPNTMTWEIDAIAEQVI